MPAGVSGVGLAISERKNARDLCSSGREVGVISGMQRKCVRRFGGLRAGMFCDIFIGSGRLGKLGCRL
jgi:hypothetical protein